MFQNYFTVALRNILKNKVFSTINVLGLSIGLASCVLIIQVVVFELSYDAFHEKLQRTYRVTNDRFQHGRLIQHGTIMYPTIGPTMAKDFPEIEMYTRLMPGGTLNVKIGEKNFRGERYHFADEHFFSVFSFNLVAGKREGLLKDPYTAVVTVATAKKYFGDVGNDYQALIGKTFYWGLDQSPYRVDGICEDIPVNSHIQFDALVSYSTLYSGEDKNADNSWTWSDMRHYLVLKRGTDYKMLESKFPAFSDRYFQGDKVSGSTEKFYLQPLKHAHLYSDYEYDIATTASGKAVWAMLIIAIFILIIAWINYINLTTSRALERAKEVGLRKVMGAVRKQLIKQFVIESFIITFVAVVVAIGLVVLLQSSFNRVVGYNLSLGNMLPSMTLSHVLLLLGVFVAGALLSGFYPAFIMSSYQPATVLKGKFLRSSRGNFLRKALVVFQFASSTTLIIGTFVVGKQLAFMNDADLGINIKNIITIKSPELMPWDSTFIQRVESYKDALADINGVFGVTTTGRLPGDRLGRSFGVRLSDSESHYTLSNMNVDYSFFDTYNVSLHAGRKFVPSDHDADFDKLNKVILNKNAAQLLGLKSPEEAVGKEIIWGDNDTRRWTIIGVVNDFHQEGLQKPMEPIFFRPVYSTGSPTSVRVDASTLPITIAAIEETYKKFFPGNSFEYSLLEDNYKRQYNDEARFGKVISIFTFLAIIVSCLGLVGLASFTAAQRTKEIGIRKVLGASTANVIRILSYDFVRLVLVAAVISLPIAYISSNNWLEGYAYRITPDWTMFMIPVATVLIIAALTIGFQVIKTALTNPAETIRYE
jgi:putative ABC transport system permease protein